MRLKKLFQYIPLFIIFLFISCSSTKDLNREMRTMITSLGYELTSPEYKGELYCNVLLNPIEGAGLVPQTTIIKKGNVVVPLILVNYVGEKYESSLGETSLDIPYQQFLTEAFLAECNTSSCFNLYKAEDSTNVESDFLLDIKVGKCQTKSKFKFNNTAILWVDIFNGDGDFMSFFNHKLNPATTELEFKVTLTHKNNPIFNKDYKVTHTNNENSIRREGNINYDSLNNMAESLSLATKEIVERISTDLSLTIENYTY